MISKLLRLRLLILGVENAFPSTAFSAIRTISSLLITWNGGRSQERASTSRQCQSTRKTDCARGESAAVPGIRHAFPSSRPRGSPADAIMRSHDSENHSQRFSRKSSASRISASGNKYLVSLIGVLDHLTREGTQCPVGFLGSLRKLHAEMPGDKSGQPQFLVSAQPRGDHGIKNIAWGRTAQRDAACADRSPHHGEPAASAQAPRREAGARIRQADRPAGSRARC